MQTGPACYICNATTCLEEHHCNLQAQGGTTRQTIWLCANCHASAHKQARAAKSKNPDIKGKQYFPPELRIRAQPVVEAMLHGEMIYNTQRESYQDHAMQPQMFEVSPRQLQRLHLIKQQNGFSNMADFWQSVVSSLTGVRAWSKDAPSCERPPTPQEIAMLRNKPIR
jgi:hypothetical protein